MAKGYVYVLSNPSMPGIVKVGRSIEGGKERAKRLFQTGVPCPFELEYELLTDEVEYVETEAHRLLADCRVIRSREFFKAFPSDAWVAVMNAHATLMDMIVVRTDEIVGPDAISEYVDALSRKGINAIPPEVASALSIVDADFAEKAIERWDRIVAAHIEELKRR